MKKRTKNENGHGARPSAEELAERLKLKVSFFDGLEGRRWTVSEHYLVLFMAKTAEEAYAFYQQLVDKRARSQPSPEDTPQS